MYPFALVMTVDGETEMAASNAGAEKPVVAEVVESLTAGLISNRDQYRAVAVTARVRLTMNDGSPVNAVLVRLDHKEGPALDVYAPYTLKGRRRKV
ncbi:MAG: hypothetical protein LBJ02_02135, partial [Bifidobacteriaceae bacterium]|nr:hypothetical protein [Bifidobacteriaceae bacterium]